MTKPPKIELLDYKKWIEEGKVANAAVMLSYYDKINEIISYINKEAEDGPPS